MEDKSLQAAGIIEILTHALEAVCDNEVDNAYEAKQKIVNKISELIDEI